MPFPIHARFWLPADVRRAADDFDAQLGGFLTTEHKDDGTHGALTADSLSVSGAVAVAGATTLHAVTGTAGVFTTIRVTGLSTLTGGAALGAAATWSSVDGTLSIDASNLVVVGDSLNVKTVTWAFLDTNGNTWIQLATGAAPKAEFNTAFSAASGTNAFAGKLNLGGVVNLKGYTVATLPAGTLGDYAYVTDALAPTFLAAVVGGGAIKTPVFYNGTNWVGA